MSAATLPPPRPPVCLTRSYLSRGVKGGTLIAEDVLRLEDHKARLEDPDGYRPSRCQNCGSHRLHAHSFRYRKLREADSREPDLVVEVRLFRCAEVSCGAVFTVVPGFVARHLWRAWRTVEAVMTGRARAPKSTVRRWMSRLAADASQLVQIFAATVRGTVVDALTGRWPATRAAFIEGVKPFLSATAPVAILAGWIHRQEAGVRLM